MSDIPGYFARTTPSGIRVIELDYWADPAKTEEWAREARKPYTDRAWRREMLRDWSAAAGDPWYPEWQIAGGDKVFVHPAAGVIPGLPIHRGWDFGIRYGAVTWSQYSPAQRRWWVLREVMPEGLSTYSLRDIVLYLSGQLQLDDLNLQAKAWVARLNEPDSPYPPGPWFKSVGPVPLRFIDWSGHEALQPRAEVAQEVEERTSAQILAAGGVYLTPLYGAVKGADQIIRDLMRVRDDGWPGLFLDPACRILRGGLSGGIVFAKGTAENPSPEKPHKDGYFEHTHEALLYSMASTVPAADKAPTDQGELVVMDRRVVRLEPQETAFDLYELRHGRP